MICRSTVRKFRTVQIESELDESSVIRNFRTTASDGKKKGRGVITPSTYAAPLNTSQSSIRNGNYTTENK